MHASINVGNTYTDEHTAARSLVCVQQVCEPRPDNAHEQKCAMKFFAAQFRGEDATVRTGVQCSAERRPNRNCQSSVCDHTQGHKDSGETESTRNNLSLLNRVRKPLGTHPVGSRDLNSKPHQADSVMPIGMLIATHSTNSNRGKNFENKKPKTPNALETFKNRAMRLIIG